jgi:uncharacterized protein YaiL (DUF2058 family)
MTDSLRDQLLGLGFKPAPKPERPATPPRGDKPAHGKPAHGRPVHGRPPHARPDAGKSAGRDPGKPRDARPARGPARSGSEMDLAKAYAIRAQKEKDERIAAERERQLEAQRRREGKQKLADLLKTASVNDPAAEIARHFEYGGKIRRVYVTAEQLKAVNSGALAVVQQGGRYHLVSPAHAIEADALLPGVLALQVDPDAPPEDDIYADPQYQVPDDLVW